MPLGGGRLTTRLRWLSSETLGVLLLKTVLQPFIGQLVGGGRGLGFIVMVAGGQLSELTAVVRMLRVCRGSG